MNHRFSNNGLTLNNSNPYYDCYGMTSSESHPSCFCFRSGPLNPTSRTTLTQLHCPQWRPTIASSPREAKTKPFNSMTWAIKRNTEPYCTMAVSDHVTCSVVSSHGLRFPFDRHHLMSGVPRLVSFTQRRRRWSHLCVEHHKMGTFKILQSSQVGALKHIRGLCAFLAKDVEKYDYMIS